MDLVFNLEGRRVKLQFPSSGLQVPGLRFKVSGLRSQVHGLRFQVQSARFRVPGSRFRVQGSRSEVELVPWHRRKRHTLLRSLSGVRKKPLRFVKLAFWGIGKPSRFVNVILWGAETTATLC